MIEKVLTYFLAFICKNMTTTTESHFFCILDHAFTLLYHLFASNLLRFYLSCAKETQGNVLLLEVFKLGVKKSYNGLFKMPFRFHRLFRIYLGMI
jgi:hypothetical protein